MSSCDALVGLKKAEAEAIKAWQESPPTRYDKPDWTLAAADDAADAIEEHVSECKTCKANGLKADVPCEPSLAQMRCREARTNEMPAALAKATGND